MSPATRPDRRSSPRRSRQLQRGVSELEVEVDEEGFKPDRPRRGEVRCDHRLPTAALRGEHGHDLPVGAVPQRLSRPFGSRTARSRRLRQDEHVGCADVYSRLDDPVRLAVYGEDQRCVGDLPQASYVLCDTR